MPDTNAIRHARRAFAWLRAHGVTTAPGVCASSAGATVTLDEPTFAQLTAGRELVADNLPPSGTRWRCGVTDTLTLETYQ